jgi:redox-sensitive bicupin YhaK (pirin superfamily)
MLTKIDNSVKFGKKQGGFGIEILYPGTMVPDSDDTGIATIGRIDQAMVTPGTLIPMHPHRDDEILTYLRKGKVKHLDSEGKTGQISNTNLMMMNAGARFYHEELVLVEEGVLEGLQIFIRPEQSGLKPTVQFHEFADTYSMNEWRAIAGKEESYPLQIRSSTWIFDMRLQKDQSQVLPTMPIVRASCLLYVFDGEVLVQGGITLTKGESMFIENEAITFTARQTSDMVLFVTDKNSRYATNGMYSGNQRK